MKDVLKNQVRTILQQFPETRNLDISLMIAIWVNYYGVQETIPVKKLYDLPTHESIKRLRAKFCEEGHAWAYPTDWKVAKVRKIKEEEWRIKLGYMPPKRSVYLEVNNKVISMPEDKVQEFLQLNPNAQRVG